MGFKTIIGETLGMAQRGGSVQSHVRFGETVYSPIISEGESDILITLEPAEALRVTRYLGKKTVVLMNTESELPISVLLNQSKYPEIDRIESILRNLCSRVYAFNASEIARKAGSPRSLNVVMLGAYMSVEKSILSIESVVEAMKSTLPSQYEEQNMRALKLGMNEMEKRT